MKRRLQHLFLTLVLLLCGTAAFAQGKVYTRKARLEDFPIRTTKVVLAGNSCMELALLRSSNNYYFLTLAQQEGIAYLILTKGGREDETESLRKPFEVVRIPIASVDDPSGRELLFMGAFLDILQAFVEEAIVSDKTAYAGLAAVNNGKLTGKRVYLDPDAADEAFARQERNALVGITIAPVQITFRSVCYKMLVSADTHELFYFDKGRYKGPNDARFTDAEAKRFDRRGAILVQAGAI